MTHSTGTEYSGKRVVILGMARQGMALARHFLTAGANVTLSDARSAEMLSETIAELTQYTAEHHLPDAELVLGGHPPALLDNTNLLCLSGGVSPALPIVQEAVRRGVPLSNDALLTLQQSQVPTLGITGSAGKTTTTTLVGLMLEASGFRVHVGGNIGTPLLDRLERVDLGDKIVMELSSFQLELFDRSPAIAGLLNVTPNHLDRHPSMSHYAAAKANILRFQEPGNACVLNADDAVTGEWLRSGRCHIPEGEGQSEVYFPLRGVRLSFSLTQEVQAGASLRGKALIWRDPGGPETVICRVEDVPLRGRHNLANILAACCLAGLAGADLHAMAGAATSFRGVEHRLELVQAHNGVLWVNDSIATTPERAIAALESFAEPIVLLAGGRDKHLPWTEFARVVGRRTRHVVLFGEAAGLIQAAMDAAEDAKHVPVTRCADLPEAVATANRVAKSGDVVLLAPGGTSFDAYVDFAARGEHFRHLVETLT